MFNTVLFPIDQSREAVETAGKALELARSHGSRMVLLSVVQPERPDMHDHATVAWSCMSGRSGCTTESNTMRLP